MSDITLGKLQAALASATNEVTVAAANINFDFTLVKIEAPPEYQPLGGILSSTRKQNAEGGPIHVTARRLGALFEGVCPQAPNIIKAYGKRISEISAEASRISGKRTSWIFPEYAGVDATSIWAAVTSSNAAIHAHLLACMLARFWTDAEAISVWVEIIEERRREIATRFEQGEAVPFASTAAATQQEITRDQIAKWDASARAWLRTADAVKDRQQKQLLLIIRNLSLPVNDESITYQSVMKAWTKSIETMEKIINGASFDVRDGAILVALSAWHLYPDMVVHGGPKNTQEIDMYDDLISSSGVLTLGLTGGMKRLDGGVHWSLPLRHLKFYGSAVRRMRNLQFDDARLSFTELLLANIGVILASWKVETRETLSCLKLLQGLMSLIPAHPNPGIYLQDELYNCVAEPLKAYFEDEHHGQLLLSLGRRRRPKFQDKDSAPYFGLLDLNTLLEVLEGPDERIELLRRIIRRFEAQTGLSQQEMLILYAEKLGPTEQPSSPRFASATQTHVNDDERAWKKVASHCRWVPDPTSHRWLRSERVYDINPRFMNAEFTGTSIRIREENKVFDLFCGQVGLAAIYKLRTDRDLATLSTEHLSLLAQDLSWCVQSELLDLEAFTKHLRSITELKHDPTMRALRQLAVASRIYRSSEMMGATISPRLLDHPFNPTWYDSQHRPDNGRMKSLEDIASAEAFSIVAHFELGYEAILQRNASHQVTEDLLGLSAGDSLYIRRDLIADPFERVTSFELVRLLGNIGKPGVAFLQAARDPMIRELNSGGWKVLQFENFDGKPEDCFQGTTLHLTLTDWSLPVSSVATYGQRDVDAQVCEAIISVRDSGVWVADVRASKSREDEACAHVCSRPSTCPHARDLRPSQQMTSLKSWNEILEGCSGLAVAQAYKNSLARQAILLVLREHYNGQSIVVCPEDMCWGCLSSETKLLHHADSQIWIL